ncbi:MAG TPA: helix-turn-helix domain-containing protein [Acidimicrobiales bacterium]|nr:helix-turn-helix domain-containing protein [Acidimicrobiales bacterium]
MRTLLNREDRAAAILRGAAAAFARSGFAATSMEDVAAASGITKLIVYRHFDSKEDLYRAVLEQVSNRQVEVFLENLQGGTQTLGVRTYLTVARELPDAFVLLWRHAAREPQFADYARAFRQRAVDVAAASLAASFATRPTLARWAPEALIDSLVVLVLGWLDHGDPADDDAFLESAARGMRAMVAAWQ